MTLHFHHFASDAPPGRRLHFVTVEYETHGSPLGGRELRQWQRYVTGADDCAHAYTVARRHVEAFKRVFRVAGGRASLVQT